MFCTKCGKPLSDNAKFCTACGAPQDPGKAPVSERPAPAPAPTPTPYADPYAAPRKKRLSGGMIALIVAGVVVLLASIVLLGLFLLGVIGGGSDGDVPAPGPDVPAAAPTDQPIDAAYDISLMDGTYYCAQEAGSTLELYSQGEQLSIYKTSYGSVDVSTLIDAPTGPNFTINYGGRLIEFYYSASGQSVTVTEAGYSSIFTTDGDRNWVVDATEGMPDPFNDPNGYILPTDTQYITESDLYPFSEEEVKLIRNEIYARHGYSFTMDKFRDYFNEKSWYFENPSVNADTFGTEQMNDYERANVDVIKAYEEKMGW